VVGAAPGDAGCAQLERVLPDVAATVTLPGMPRPHRSSFERRVLTPDDRPRLVCTDCGFVDYENPKIVVGSVVRTDDRILLCRRAIEPRAGFWTIPAGYLEIGETPEEGAMREAREEACARIEIEALLAVYGIPRLGQVQLIFRSRLAAPGIAAGPESREVALFTWDRIPWDELAFPSVRWALDYFARTRELTVFAPQRGPSGEHAGG
jgi:ADP-ribose pyrophosphatase YjhB (NUDIX family)